MVTESASAESVAGGLTAKSLDIGFPRVFCRHHKDLIGGLVRLSFGVGFGLGLDRHGGSGATKKDLLGGGMDVWEKTTSPFVTPIPWGICGVSQIIPRTCQIKDCRVIGITVTIKPGGQDKVGLGHGIIEDQTEGKSGKKRGKNPK